MNNWRENKLNNGLNVMKTEFQKRNRTPVKRPVKLVEGDDGSSCKAKSIDFKRSQPRCPITGRFSKIKNNGEKEAVFTVDAHRCVTIESPSMSDEKFQQAQPKKYPDNVAEMLKTKSAKTQENKRIFLKHFRKNNGSVREACKLTGIHVNTYHLWKKSDEEFRYSIEDINEELLDIAEAALMEKVKKGNMRAIIFYLNARGGSRGYGNGKKRASADIEDAATNHQSNTDHQDNAREDNNDLIKKKVAISPEAIKKGMAILAKYCPEEAKDIMDGSMEDESLAHDGQSNLHTGSASEDS